MSKGKLVYKDKNRGKIYEGGRLLTDVVYTLSQYEESARSKPIGFINQKRKPSTWVEVYIEAPDISIFTGQDATLELVDGCRIDGVVEALPANLALFLSKKALYKP